MMIATKEVKKKVEKMVASDNFYYIVIKRIKEDGCLPDVRELNLSKQARQYYVNKLVSRGVIYKKGYGVWGYNEEKYVELQKERSKKKMVAVTLRSTSKEVLLKSKKIRGHGFQWTIKIPRIHNWKNRRDYLNSKKIDWKPIGSNWEGERIVFRNHKVWLTNSSIVIYAPESLSYFASSAKESKERAVYDMIMLMKGLCSLLGVDFRIKGKFWWKCSRSQYASIENELARQVNNQGQRLRIADRSGVWLITDLSFSDELETTHATTSDRDMDKVVTPFLNKLKENPRLLDDIEQMIKALKDSVETQVKLGEVQAELNKETALGLKSVVDIMKLERVTVNSSVPDVKRERPDYVM